MKEAIVLGLALIFAARFLFVREWVKQTLRWK